MSGGNAQGAMPEAGEGTRTITTTVGKSLTVHLWEDRTRGEQWVPTYDRTALSLLSDDFLRIASNNAVDSGRRTFEFHVVRPGAHRLLFEKRMGWKFTAEDRRSFLIEASG